MSKPKWSVDGLYVWDSSIVGTVQRAPNGLWYAHGCEDDWQDVHLGSHVRESQAKKAVASWVKENCS